MSYSSADLMRLAGVTYRQVDYWARIELLGPDSRQRQGSGNDRTFTADQLDLCRLLGAASTLGIRNLAAIAEAWQAGRWTLDGDALTLAITSTLAITIGPREL